MEPWSPNWEQAILNITERLLVLHSKPDLRSTWSGAETHRTWLKKPVFVRPPSAGAIHEQQLVRKEGTRRALKPLLTFRIPFKGHHLQETCSVSAAARGLAMGTAFLVVSSGNAANPCFREADVPSSTNL